MSSQTIKRFIPVILAVFLLCGLPLAGCQPAATIEEHGGVLNLYGIDPFTLDPAVAADMTSNEYIEQLFSGLVSLDDNLEPAPDIALTWDISRDGMTYTFHLREDARFHDGRQVTAADFKYAWERACDPATGSRTAATYLGDIVGVGDVLSGKTRDISGVSVAGDYTLRVTIDAPKTYFLAKLTYPIAFVVDRANVAAGSEWWRQPNGTGPFRLREWDESNQLVLERSELYYGRKAGVDRVVYNLWGGVPMRMYETGEIDVAETSVDYIDRVTDEAGPFYLDLQVVPELSFNYIVFNTSRPPFDDASIRRAFSMAVDKDRLVSLVFRDMVKKADGILPPGLPGYDEGLAGLEFDVAGAKALIAASKYGGVDGLPPITVTTTGWGGIISPVLEAIIQEWRDNLGVDVKVRQLEPERFLYHLVGEKDELIDYGWVADYPHPQDFLDVLFHTGAENNIGDYSNAAVDALLDRAAVEPDKDLSLELYRQAEQLLVDDAACLPLYFGENYILVKPYVEGYELSPMGFAMLNTVSIKSG